MAHCTTIIIATIMFWETPYDVQFIHAHLTGAMMLKSQPNYQTNLALHFKESKPYKKNCVGDVIAYHQ